MNRFRVFSVRFSRGDDDVGVSSGTDISASYSSAFSSGSFIQFVINASHSGWAVDKLAPSPPPSTGINWLLEVESPVTYKYSSDRIHKLSLASLDRMSRDSAVN